MLSLAHSFDGLTTQHYSCIVRSRLSTLDARRSLHTRLQIHCASALDSGPRLNRLEPATQSLALPLAIESQERGGKQVAESRTDTTPSAHCSPAARLLQSFRMCTRFLFPLLSYDAFIRFAGARLALRNSVSRIAAHFTPPRSQQPDQTLR